MNSKVKKRVKQRVQNARERSHTVFANNPRNIIDEIATFHETYTGPFIYLDGNLRDDNPPVAKCTCGEFETVPDSNLLALGRAAKAHFEESGHRLRGMA